MASKKFALSNIEAVPGGDAGPNAYLAGQRGQIMDEIASKPWLLTWLAAIGEKELSGNPLPILESLVNRAEMTGKSLEDLTSARRGFYGTVNSGDVQRYINAGIPQSVIDNTTKALGQIKAGSNVTLGATDQGAKGHMWSPWQAEVGGERFGDMPGNPANPWGRSSAFRIAQQAKASPNPPQATSSPATPLTANVTPSIAEQLADNTQAPPSATYDKEEATYPLPRGSSWADQVLMWGHGLHPAAGGQGPYADMGPVPIVPGEKLTPQGTPQMPPYMNPLPRAPWLEGQPQTGGQASPYALPNAGVPMGATGPTIAPPVNGIFPDNRPAPGIDVFPKTPPSQDDMSEAIQQYLQSPQYSQDYGSTDYGSYAGAY